MEEEDEDESDDDKNDEDENNDDDDDDMNDDRNDDDINDDNDNEDNMNDGFEGNEDQLDQEDNEGANNNDREEEYDVSGIPKLDPPTDVDCSDRQQVEGYATSGRTRSRKNFLPRVSLIISLIRERRPLRKLKMRRCLVCW